jgi:hypothetical protein
VYPSDFPEALLEYARALARKPDTERRLLADAERRAQREGIGLAQAVARELRESPIVADMIDDPELAMNPRTVMEERLERLSADRPWASADYIFFAVERDDPALALVADAYENDPDTLRVACEAVGRKGGEAMANRRNVVELVSKEIQSRRDAEDRMIREAARRLAEGVRGRAS